MDNSDYHEWIASITEVVVTIVKDDCEERQYDVATLFDARDVSTDGIGGAEIVESFWCNSPEESRREADAYCQQRGWKIVESQ